jgi:hypothetical protein
VQDHAEWYILKTIENIIMEEVKKVPKKRGRKPQNAEAPKYKFFPLE